MPNTRTKTASLMSLEDPKFLTLTKNPSNRRGFKVIRSDPLPDVADSTPRSVRVRTKRADLPGLLAISLPEGLDEEGVDGVINQFKLGDDYKVQDVDGQRVLVRNSADATSLEDYAPVRFGDYTAYLDKAHLYARSDAEGSSTGVTLMRIEFGEQVGGEENVIRWLEDNEIVKPAEEIAGLEILQDGGAVFTRHEVPEGVEAVTNRVRFDDGVYGYVALTEQTDLPSSVERSITETAYGQWGWGSLDFVQSVADVSFSERVSEAVSSLNSVLDNVLYYSGLTVDERRKLVQDATTSFSTYVVGLLDSLPREAVQRSDTATTQNTGEEPMSKNIETKDDKAVGAQDDAPTPEFVTRADFDKLVASVNTLSEAITAKTEGKDEPDTDSKEAKRAEEGTPATVSEPGGMAALTELMTKMDEKLEGVTRAVQGIKTEVDELADTTTVNRSADGDEDHVNDDQGLEGTPKSAFRGMFGNGLADLTQQ